MQIPIELQEAIEPFFENLSQKELVAAREALTQVYKVGGVSPFANKEKRLAYLGARMPATYAAVHKVLQNVEMKGHLLDLGAGPATASWAAVDRFPHLEKITLVELSRDAIELGKALAEKHPVLKRGVWLQQSLEESIPKADIAILSYVLNELSNPEKVVLRCLDAVDTLILIEPGTPKAFKLMKKIREMLIQTGMKIIAPCPHLYTCPNDWCHFSARVERSRIHRLLKEGSLGHEDEKFCYLIMTKSEITPAKNRIVRHPLKHKGHVKLALCTEEGTLAEKTVSRKDKELYRMARDAEWGDSF
jgi:ribosomal protein RSM22 (predicted rRNA methylase)